MGKITVITADVIESRKAGLDQAALTQSLKEIAHPSLLVPFAVSRGDEVQGVISGWMSVPQMVRLLRWRCRPLQLRIGIGIGYHDGRLGDDPWKLSGPAFFLARKALESIATSKDPATQVATGEDALDALINSAWLLLDTLMTRWTPGQWEAVMTYEQTGTYAAAAKVLDVAAQNVQKRCKAAHWHQIRHAEQSLSKAEDLFLTLSRVK